MHRTMLLALAVMTTLAATASGRESAADRFYQRLRALEGEWEGTLQWSGGRDASGSLRATYVLTAGGHSLIENLFMDAATTASMSSVYHIDGSDLRMTHYCLARNQPRLKSTTIDEAAGIVEFAEVDVTGTDPPNRAHVQKVRLQLVGADELRVWFTFGGGSSSTTDVEAISLRRKK